MSKSSTQCECVATYMDGVKVKIADVYQKPKIVFPSAYYTKMPDVSKCTYNFNREKRLFEKVKIFKIKFHNFIFFNFFFC